MTSQPVLDGGGAGHMRSPTELEAWRLRGNKKQAAKPRLTKPIVCSTPGGLWGTGAWSSPKRQTPQPPSLRPLGERQPAVAASEKVHHNHGLGQAPPAHLVKLLRSGSDSQFVVRTSDKVASKGSSRGGGGLEAGSSPAKSLRLQTAMSMDDLSSSKRPQEHGRHVRLKPLKVAPLNLDTGRLSLVPSGGASPATASAGGSTRSGDADRQLVLWSPDGALKTKGSDKSASPTRPSRCGNEGLDITEPQSSRHGDEGPDISENEGPEIGEITRVAQRILRDLDGFQDAATRLDSLLSSQEKFKNDPGAVAAEAANDPVLQRARQVAACAEAYDNGDGLREPAIPPSVRNVVSTTRKLVEDLEQTMIGIWASSAFSAADAGGSDELSPGPKADDDAPTDDTPPEREPENSRLSSRSRSPKTQKSDNNGLPLLSERLEQIGKECITEADIPKLQLTFKRFKVDGTNDLHKDSIPVVLGYLGHVMTMGDGIWDLYDQVTTYDYIDFDEFYQFMEKYIVYEIEEFNRVFLEFDEDGSGGMDVEELRLLLSSLGITPLKGMFDEALAHVNADETGALDFGEFMKFLVVYRHAEGFTKAEVGALRKAFNRLMVNDTLPAASLCDALVRVFGLQLEKEAIKLTEELERDNEGLLFFEYLIFARRAREMQRGKLLADCYKFGRAISKLAMFDQCDKDRDGNISLQELREALRSMGYAPLLGPMEEVLTEILYGVDAKVRSTTALSLDFDQFFDFMLLYRQRDGFLSSQIAELNRVFTRFDTDGEEEINAVELADIFRYLGYSPNMEEIHLYLAKVDANGSGSLDFREFITLMAMHRKTEVVQAQNVFGKYVSKEEKDKLLIDSRTDILSALLELGVEPPAEVVKTFPKEVNFDDFFALKDSCREDFVIKQRKKAGFSDEEVESFRDAFDRYDKDKSGEVDNLELQKILKDFGWEIRSLEEQKQLLVKLDQARVLAQEAGVENGTEAGSTDLVFWEFVQLSRILEKERDLKEIEDMNRLMLELSFSAAEVDEFRVIFHHRTKPPEDETEDEAAGHRPAKRQAASLSREDMKRLLRSAGARITTTNVTVLDAEFKKVASEQGNFDFPAFLRLVRWLIDTNFGGWNDPPPADRA